MNLREKNLTRLREEKHDVLIVGGGINGAVSAASLSAKGVKTALIDKGDFADFTSSNSSNLVWGGIKYLESHEYLLVNKLCKSRNHLMRTYPSSVKEIRFLTTIQKGFRFPPFFVFLGTILYWFLGRFFTKFPSYLTPNMLKHREPVIEVSNAAGGFEYSDSYLSDNDARFVFNFIRSSIDYGCAAANYVESLGSEYKDNTWITRVRNNINGEVFSVRSKVVINACGPYVDQYNQLTDQITEHRHLFSKGIHLIVDRITESEKVLAFFASDGRLFFVIPMGQKTCIGTTDTQVENPETVVTDEDRRFVLDNVNTLLHLGKPLTVDDIISERCGVRPLALKGQNGTADWVKLSQKHAIDTNMGKRYLSIFGGKLTDCINVGEEVCDIVAKMGVKIPSKNQMWYGEPGVEEKRRYFYYANLMGLEKIAKSSVRELISERFVASLWEECAKHDKNN